jgi:hypothetical protein
MTKITLVRRASSPLHDLLSKDHLDLQPRASQLLQYDLEPPSDASGENDYSESSAGLR